MNVGDLLRFGAARASDRSALVAGSRTWTFAELDAWVDRLAGWVAARTDPGDRVGIVARNRPAYVACSYAVPRSGRVLALLNQRLAPVELAALCADAGARVVVGDPEPLAALEPLRATMPTVEALVGLDELGEEALGHGPLVDSVPHPPPVDDRAPAWLIHTSGTTGRPKGVVLTHASLTASVANTLLGRPVRPDDVYLFPFPLCHVAGYNVAVHHLVGRPVVLLEGFDSAEVLDTVARHRVTSLSLAPTMIRMLLDDPGLGRADLTSLRTIGYGASAIPATTLVEGLERLGCDFAQGYGMTELSGNAVFLDGHAHRRAASSEPHLLGAAGVPGPLVRLRIVDEQRAELPPGHDGEILVAGDQLAAGYWGDPDATAATFAGGWLHTGDVGRLDADGVLYVVDRKKDLVVSGGENVASREVEDVVLRHPTVREVAVVGVPDPTWGEAVCAVVRLTPGAAFDPDDIVASCRGHLAGFKKPRHVLVLDELPKNASGKVAKRELRSWARSQVEGDRGTDRGSGGDEHSLAHEGPDAHPGTVDLHRDRAVGGDGGDDTPLPGEDV